MTSPVYLPTILILVLLPALVSSAQSANYKCSANNTHAALELFVYKDNETIEKVYAEGLEATCLATGTGTLADPFTIVVELDPNGITTTARQVACGVMANPAGSQNYVLQALTQSLPDAFKATDRRYTVNCDPTAQKSQDTATGTIALAQQTTFTNGLTTEISEFVSINLIDFMNGQPLTTANFGQTVRLQVVLTPVSSGATGVMVTDCQAMGGTLPGAPVLSLIEDGCGDPDTTIFDVNSGFETNGIDHTVSVSPAFQMFMFTDVQLPVIFSCKVEFCYGGDDCTRRCGQALGRRKRAAEEEVKKEVIAVVAVAAEDRELLENGAHRQLCSDWPYVVSLAALSGVLLVTLGFVIWFYAQLRKQQAK